MRAAVPMVSTELPAAPFSATDAGEKLHAAPVGAPEHAKATVPLNPLFGVNVTVAVADVPAATELSAGTTATAKSGVAPDTVKLTAAELLPAKVESPPYSAINDWVPAVNEAVVMVALPWDETAELPRRLVPVRKLTVPVGVPAALEVTLAVSVPPVLPRRDWGQRSVPCSSPIPRRRQGPID